MTKPYLFRVLLISLFLALVACGGGNGGTAPTGTDNSTSSDGSSGSSSDGSSGSTADTTAPTLISNSVSTRLMDTSTSLFSFLAKSNALYAQIKST